MSMYGGSGGMGGMGGAFPGSFRGGMAGGTPTNGLAMGDSPFGWGGNNGAQGTAVGGNPYMGSLMGQIGQNNSGWNNQQMMDRANSLKQQYAPGNTLNADQTGALQNYAANTWRGFNQNGGSGWDNPMMSNLMNQVKQNNPGWNDQQIMDRANMLKQQYAPGNTLNADQSAALQNYMGGAWQGANQGGMPFRPAGVNGNYGNQLQNAMYRQQGNMMAQNSPNQYANLQNMVAQNHPAWSQNQVDRRAAMRLGKRGV